MKYSISIIASFVILMTSCFNQNDYLYYSPQDVICLSNQADTLLADGVSKTRLVAQLRIDSDKNKSQVTFATTKGAFEGVEAKTITDQATRTYYNSNEACFDTAALSATAWLVSDLSPGYATLTASVEGVVTNTQQIYFKPALPQSISMSIDKYKLLANIEDKITVTASLGRNQGKPSVGQEVQFKILQTSGLDVTNSFILTETAAKSNVEAMVNISFVALDTALVGRFLLQSVVEGEIGSLVDTKSFVIE